MERWEVAYLRSFGLNVLSNIFIKPISNISQDSVKNGEKVVASITEAVYKAARNPEMYNPDKDRCDNDGSYRAFEKHRYRVSYRFNNNVLRVLRVRHTRKHPRSY